MTVFRLKHSTFITTERPAQLLQIWKLCLQIYPEGRAEYQVTENSIKLHCLRFIYAKKSLLDQFVDSKLHHTFHSKQEIKMLRLGKQIVV